MATIPQSVLVAVDFGDASARAVAIGGIIAAQCRATLRLLHSESMEAPVYFTSEQLERLERERHALHAQVDAFLTQFGREHTSVPFSSGIDTLPPVDAILRESVASDLVVMGTHGRHGPKRWWLGSVAERVLRDITRPLLVVRAEHDQPIASLFERALVHAAAPLVGAATLQFARDLRPYVGGEVIDGRHELIEPGIQQTRATIVIAAVPEPRTSGWLSDFGEPLVRFCSVPILFVPEGGQGALT
jgi:nucleotide-binding universal stress UspA family protein